jgi:hypothetical protein
VIAALVQGKRDESVSWTLRRHDEAVPYLPFVEMFESYVRGLATANGVRALLGEEGPELARLLPRLRRLIPDLPAPPELSPEQARRNLFDGFRDFVGRHSEDLIIGSDLIECRRPISR